MGSVKRDINNFEYNKRYKIYSEHKLDFLLDDEKAKEYYDYIEQITKPNITKTQSDPDTIGQIGTMI